MTKDSKKAEAYVREVTESTLSYVQELKRDVAGLRERIAALELDRARLEREVQERAERMSSQFVRVERQNADLAGLYVASFRLHETLEREDVLTVIQEILANLIGSEEIGIYELSADGATLRALRLAGLDAARFATLPAKGGVAGRVVESGEIWVAGEAGDASAGPHEDGLTACVPLRVSGKVIGVVAVFRLLQQKAALTRVDHELFELLATQAATALYSSALHARETARLRGSL